MCSDVSFSCRRLIVRVVTDSLEYFLKAFPLSHIQPSLKFYVCIEYRYSTYVIITIITTNTTTFITFVATKNMLENLMYARM